MQGKGHDCQTILEGTHLWFVYQWTAIDANLTTTFGEQTTWPKDCVQPSIHVRFSPEELLQSLVVQQNLFLPLKILTKFLHQATNQCLLKSNFPGNVISVGAPSQQERLPSMYCNCACNNCGKSGLASQNLLKRIVWQLIFTRAIGLGEFKSIYSESLRCSQGFSPAQ